MAASVEVPEAFRAVVVLVALAEVAAAAAVPAVVGDYGADSLGLQAGRVLYNFAPYDFVQYDGVLLRKTVSNLVPDDMGLRVAVAGAGTNRRLFIDLSYISS